LAWEVGKDFKIMKREYLTMAVFLIFISFIFLSPTLSVGQGSTPSEDLCTQAKKNDIAAEKEWSSLNAEVGFMRGEFDRLRDLRWEIKTTLSVLNDALHMMNEKGSLSDVQRVNLNARIPNQRGSINPDGTFTMSGLETTHLKLIEAKAMFDRLLVWSEENIKKTETELKEKEGKSYLLSQRMADFEVLVEKECKAAGTPTHWEQGQSRIGGGDIYQRYVERERMRQEEVESHRLADLDRLWLKNSYPFYGPYPYHLGYSSRALLIELKNVGNVRTCLRCYSFSSSWEERQIYGQLDRAVSKHDSIPCVGSLGEYKVIQIYDNILDCYARMSR